VNIIKKIRLKFGHWFLKKKLKSLKRRKVVHNLKTAKSAGIIFTSVKGENFQKISQFLNFLTNNQLKVYALAYVHSKEIPNEITAHSKINFFTKKDLNFYFKPKNSIIDSFTEKEFDILIDLSTKNYFPVKMINNLSHAHFKVGLADHSGKDYDLMLSLKNNQDLEYYIEQLKYYLTEINSEKNLAI
jgi:hypothetical protein